MITAKMFMEFFEKEYNVKFIDVTTGKNALDIIAENEKKNNRFNNPAYKSDYDEYLEEEKKNGRGLW